MTPLPTRRPTAGRLPGSVALTATVLGLAACSSSGVVGHLRERRCPHGHGHSPSSGCRPEPASIAAGATTFQVTNSGAAAVSELEVLQGERVLAEKENLAPGLSGSFSVSLDPGEYTPVLPGCADREDPLDGDRGTVRVARPAAPAQRWTRRSPTIRPTSRTRPANWSSPPEASPRPSPPGTWRKRRRCSAPPGPTTSGSSRWRRASAISTRTSMRGRTTSTTRRSGRASTASRRRSGSVDRRPAWARSPTSSWLMWRSCRPSPQPPSTSRRNLPTGQANCSTKSARAKSPARRTATATPTCTTSPRTSRAPRRPTSYWRRS